MKSGKSKFNQYLSHWKLWTFDYKKAAAISQPEISSFQFFIGNIIGGLFGFLSTSFFLVAELENLRISVSNNLNGGGIGNLLLAIFGTYVDTVVLVTLISAAISFGMFRVSGSKVSFKKHCARYFEISFLEPAACLFFSYALISAVTKNTASGTVFILLATLWFITRIWYCKVFWDALRTVHGMSDSQYRLAFWFGHIPAFFITNMTLGSIAWGLAGYFIISS